LDIYCVGQGLCSCRAVFKPNSCHCERFVGDDGNRPADIPQLSRKKSTGGLPSAPTY